jgi:Holliday junction resolvasome RuvABC DNA-binding subunit
VTRQDAARLVKVPGIGKKTAERLLLELKGKLGPELGAPAAVRWTTRRPTSPRPCRPWATANAKPRPR